MTAVEEISMSAYWQMMPGMFGGYMLPRVSMVLGDVHPQCGGCRDFPGDGELCPMSPKREQVSKRVKACGNYK